VKYAKNRDFTSMIVVNEDRKYPNGLLVVNLPDGPTAHFKLSSVKLSKKIKVVPYMYYWLQVKYTRDCYGQ
jgi:ribosome production factor 1